MPIIAMNVSSRKIDGLLPQQYREIDAKQAQVYKSMLPNDIKIIEVGTEASLDTSVLPQEEKVVNVIAAPLEEDDVKEEKEVIITEDEETNTPLSIEEAFGESEAI